jgi:acyl-coenzyme A synthetase/AMP-(fatty) acid ligase
MYGITETTVHASYHEICYQDLNSEKSNIGKLLPGFFYKILDDDGHQTREGELYLSGPQVTNGYIFDREKNVSRFIDLENEGGVYYKTGDIVREHENGELEYLGRNDDQVKIRGFRIELGEVESRLSSVSELSLTAVIRVDNEISGGDLACFYEVKPGHSISKRRLKLSARKILPPYMVPTYFIDVNSMPLSINGKIDKAKLVKQWRSK